MIDTITVVIVFILVYLFINKQLIIFAIVGICYFMQSILISGGGPNKTLAIVNIDGKILKPELTKVLFNRSGIIVTQYDYPKLLYGHGSNIDVIYKDIDILLRNDIIYDYIMVDAVKIKKCLPDILGKTMYKLIIYSTSPINTNEILDFDMFKKSEDFETKFINDGNIITIRKKF